jgi:hypothetical protein
MTALPGTPAIRNAVPILALVVVVLGTAFGAF